jgi:WD40 repeat protein
LWAVCLQYCSVGVFAASCSLTCAALLNYLAQRMRVCDKIKLIKIKFLTSAPMEDRKLAVKTPLLAALALLAKVLPPARTGRLAEKICRLKICCLIILGSVSSLAIGCANESANQKSMLNRQPPQRQMADGSLDQPESGEFPINSSGSPAKRSPIEGSGTLKIPNVSRRIASHNGAIAALYPVFIPGPGALSVGTDGALVAWAVGAEQGAVLGDLGQTPDATAICRDATRFAVADRQGVRILELPVVKETYLLTAVKTRVTALEFSPDCRSLLIGGGDGMIYRWRFIDIRPDLGFEAREKLLERYIGHNSAIGALVFHPFGRVFFSGDWDGTLNGWLRYDADAFRGQFDENLSPGTFFTAGAPRMQAGRTSGNDIVVIRSSADGQYLITALQNGAIGLWKVRGMRKLAEVQAHKGMVYDLQFAPDNRKLVSVGRDGLVKEWEILQSKDLSGGPDLFSLQLRRTGDAQGAQRIAALPGNRVLGGSSSGTVLELTFEK